MKRKLLVLLSVTTAFSAGTAFANELDRVGPELRAPRPNADKPAERKAEAEKPADAPQSTPAKEIFSTGVAKGRDRLDSATSTSALKGAEIQQLGTPSIAEIFRNIPGIRVESGSGEAGNSFTIRGLPLASSGAKYLQFQEDGLPVLEFGDLILLPDNVFRPDFNLAAVEAIRGGSASTFASNSPGGIINLISKTGDVAGGAIRASTGINFDQKRIDFDYGTPLSPTLRFHMGGYYRTGEGPRKTGFNGMSGGQFKFNATKDIGIGYIRVLGKYLDDSTPSYTVAPVLVSGTDSNPTYRSPAGFNLGKDTLLSPYLLNFIGRDESNNVLRDSLRNGQHTLVKSIGVESQIDLAGWTFTERFRYSGISAELKEVMPVMVGPAGQIASLFAGAGAQLRYATGPATGTAITDPASLNGNGLLVSFLGKDFRMPNVDNMTNDLRASRQWKVGGGTVTATAGYYLSRQMLKAAWAFNMGFADVRGNGKAAMVDLFTATGSQRTSAGIIAYSTGPGGGSAHRLYDVQFDTSAPYGSINFMRGKVAIGFSGRYDMGRVNGQVYGADLGGGRVGVGSLDVNGDGVISGPERTVAQLPLNSPAPVNFKYNYFSYSTGVNYRVSEPFAVFARYSRGGRGPGDRILFSPVVSTTTGDLTDPSAATAVVKQAEIGTKFRRSNLTLNLTGFWAQTTEANQQTLASSTGSIRVVYISRTYRAMGAEFEGSYVRGPFSITAGATYTSAKIDSDPVSTALVGNTPRHQPKLIFQATPQVELDKFTLGANFVGTTSSYAQDTNQLKMPGFTLVNAFAEFRPMKNVQLSLTAGNLFDTKGYTEISAPTIPANGITTGRTINGRTIMTALTLTL